MKIFKIKKKIIPEVPKIPVVTRKQKQKAALLQKLKDNPTESEKLFCQLLDQLKLKYEFQVWICGYIPDFYFPDYGNRIIELDGQWHSNRKEYDRRRDMILRQNGYRVMRIASRRMFYDVDAVIEQAQAFLAGKHSNPKRSKDKKPPIVRLPPDPLLAEFAFITQGI